MSRTGMLCATLVVAFVWAAGIGPVAFADGPNPPPAPGDVAAPPPSTDPSAPPPPPTLPPGSAPGLYTVEPVVPYAGECCPQLAEYMMPLYDPVSRLQIPWTGQWTPTEMPWTFFVGESLTYDSNIFASEHDVQDDWISNTTAGFSYRRAGSTYWALVSAALTYAAYFDHTDESSFNFWGQLDAGYDSGCFYASVSDRLAYLDNPIVQRGNVVTNINADRDRYWQNTLTLRAGYDSGCWQAELAYVLDWFTADEGFSTNFDHFDNGIMARFDRHISEKSTLGVYAAARWFTYNDSDSPDFNTYSVGITYSWRPTTKLGIVGRFGVAWSDSDVTSSTDDTFVGSLEARWDPTENFSAELGWSRQYEASIEAADQIVDLFYVRFQTLLGGCFTLDGSTGLQFGDIQHETINSPRDYTLWYVNLMLHRQLGCHWAFDAGYQYRVQNADRDGIDFDEHRLTLGVSYTF